MRTHSQVYQHEHLGERTSRAKPVLSGLLIGGLIGAGTALLFAPYLLFNLVVEGSIWPNTFYAKQAEYAFSSRYGRAGVPGMTPV